MSQAPALARHSSPGLQPFGQSGADVVAIADPGAGAAQRVGGQILIGRTGRLGPAADLGRVAGTVGRPAGDSARLQGVDGAVHAVAIAALGPVARTRRVAAQQSDWCGDGGRASGVAAVADAHPAVALAAVAGAPQRTIQVAARAAITLLTAVDRAVAAGAGSAADLDVEIVRSGHRGLPFPGDADIVGPRAEEQGVGVAIVVDVDRAGVLARQDGPAGIAAEARGRGGLEGVVGLDLCEQPGC